MIGQYFFSSTRWVRPIPGSSKNNLESLKKNLDKDDDFVYSIYLYLVVF